MLALSFWGEKRTKLQTKNLLVMLTWISNFGGGRKQSWDGHARNSEEKRKWRSSQGHRRRWFYDHDDDTIDLHDSNIIISLRWSFIHSALERCESNQYFDRFLTDLENRFQQSKSVIIAPRPSVNISSSNLIISIIFNIMIASDKQEESFNLPCFDKWRNSTFSWVRCAHTTKSWRESMILWWRIWWPVNLYPTRAPTAFPTFV